MSVWRAIAAFPALTRRATSRTVARCVSSGTVALFVLAVALASAAAAAVDESKVIFPGASAPASTPAADPGGSLGSVTLIVGLALAAVGGWFVWRGRRATPAGHEAQLAIEETRSLGNRQYLVVASYEDKKFLLAVCPGRIDLLAPLHDSVPPEKAQP